jgi:S-adenosyl-L-methionine hydrolase (adenosine-forming)
MRRPIVTLTTDFGLSSHYAAAMKGVILGICPNAQIVDISHDVSPYGIPEGAYTIAQAYPFFAKKTVHVVVVDPGVGTSRRPILVEAAGQYFVGPDNGVFTMIYAREKHKVRSITNGKLFREPVSDTFHGRDIFAPVAAQVAAGLLPSRAGKLIDDFLRLTFDQPQRTGKRTWQASILTIDRFGNIVTNIHREQFPDLAQRACELVIGPHHVVNMARNYSQTPPGELFLIFGSGGYLEVSAAQAPAAQAIGCEVGAPAELTVR